MHAERLSPVPTRERTGFTVVELLVAIGIIGMLVAILLPAVQSARENARRTICHANLKQLTLALHNYHADHNMLPAGSYTMGPAFDVASGWGWNAMTLPHLEQANVYDQIDFSQPTAVDANRTTVAHAMPFSRCPSDFTPRLITAEHPFQIEPSVQVAAGNYLGVDPLLGEFTTTRFADVVDGTMSTFLLGEQRYEYDADFDEALTNSWLGTITFTDVTTDLSLPHQRANALAMINDAGAAVRTFSSRHRGGASFSLLDGQVRLFSENMDADVYAAMGTPDGNEAIDF